ncbi:MAG TPA: DUF2490 domain-containing protein [Spirochaetota bacterium]|nr:DUF2490 domain-containing protein [Spirochaetota bacterium]
MCRRTCIVLLAALMLFALIPAGADAKAPYTGRTWEYVNVTMLLSPNWAFMVMPGHRFEFYRGADSKSSAKETFLWEFFAGPIYIHKFESFTFKLPLWYYYMGFPVDGNDGKPKVAGEDRFYSHNIEVVPIFEFSVDALKVTSRTIFHNKVYADNNIYVTENQKKGYSLLIREMIMLEYALTPMFSLLLGNEVFVGVKEDGGTKDLGRIGEPFYERNGFSENRLHAGFNVKFNPTLSLSPQYIYNTTYKPESGYRLTSRNHYIMLTLNYVLKLY